MKISEIFRKYYFPVFIFLITVTGYWDSPVRKIISLIAPLLIIGCFLGKKNLSLKSNNQVLLIIFYLFVCFLSALFAFNVFNSLFFFFRIVIFFLLIAALYDWMDDYEKYLLIVKSIVVSGLVLSISIIYSRFFGFVIVESEGAIRAGGIFTNVNSAGFILFITCIFAFLQYLENKKKRNFFYLVIFIIALIYTGSRASMLALAVSVLFYNLRFKLTRKIIITVTISAFIGLVGLFFFKDKILLNLRLERGLSARQILYDIGIDIAKDYPYLGIGLGNLKDVGPDYLMKYPVGQWQKEMLLEIGIQSSHNVFIETAAETGLMGSLLLVFIVISIGLSYYRKIKRVNGDAEKNFYYLLWGLFMGILVRCFFESNGIINRGWITIDIFFWIIYVIFLRSKNLKA